MTDDPIDLDGRRTEAGRYETEMRRRPANDAPSLVPSAQLHLGSLENQMLAEPARTWVEVMEKWRFLLERYSATPAAHDERIQKLIRRAIEDMERLRKRKERK
ncbi:hypothetical protein [Aestuariicoccus sp. MJ-SS9]|uniref:hypothetical protein n=1 Tax=Aestuariicoccus sp. MJ-SS9 TaxID=3079855 RepID=UPI0029157C28|nr:hypothetical protein [Aestuariicoccus sp. MJ-SS9]MDU8912967.1 hypothetical protein [Aestuariicoccus sp. MJ-SS9]